MMDYKTPLDAVKALRDFDHLLLSPKGMEGFNKAFGTHIKPTTYTARPNELKGLTLNDGASQADGMCAALYAELVSEKLGTGFTPWQSGRGFRLRSACDAIEEFYTKRKETHNV